MSGSGGGSNGSNVTTPCNSLKFTTDLASPKPAALSLKVGDVLEIELIENTIIATLDGEIVGGIACKESRRLAECLFSGNDFLASVMSVNVGRITISVYPR